jgi:hypothetical protein
MYGISTTYRYNTIRYRLFGWSLRCWTGVPLGSRGGARIGPQSSIIPVCLNFEVGAGQGLSGVTENAMRYSVSMSNTIR